MAAVGTGHVMLSQQKPCQMRSGQSTLACLSCSFSCSSERPSERIPLALHALCSSDTLRPPTPSLEIIWNEKERSSLVTE